MSTASAPLRLPIPHEVLTIATKLEAAGFETWCVGGAVRDSLLGLQNADFDLTTAAPPQDVQRLFRHTVPVGIEHGTVAVLDEKRKAHEVTTFRRDVRTDGRHAEVEFGTSLDEDLARRDFTINALAYHPVRHEFRDRFDGRGDLQRKIIRAVGDPARRFTEDYLRILRMVRFATRFGFAIEPRTWEAAVTAASGLSRLSAERVRDEWMKSLEKAIRRADVVMLWDRLGARAALLPEVPDPATLGDARLAALDRLPTRDPLLATVLLSSDPAATLVRLRCSNAQVERARHVSGLSDSRPAASDGRAVRRWMAAAGESRDGAGVTGDLVALAHALDPAAAADLEAAVERERTAKVPLAVGDLAVNGRDLLAAGVPAGPHVGVILRHLLDAVLDRPGLNTRDDLLRLAADSSSRGPAC